MIRPFRRRGYSLEKMRELARRQLSTGGVGQISGDAAWGAPVTVGHHHFEESNPWRWKPGQSGNPLGRPKRPDDDYNRLVLTLLDLIGRVSALEWGHLRQRDERLAKFKVLYGITGNALQSALVAGYSPKMAKSKAYLLARRAVEAGSMSPSRVRRAS